MSSKWSTGQAWHHKEDNMITSFPTWEEAGKTSVVPSKPKADKTNLEAKRDPQDKPGTTKRETTLNRSTNEKGKENREEVALTQMPDKSRPGTNEIKRNFRDLPVQSQLRVFPSFFILTRTCTRSTPSCARATAAWVYGTKTLAEEESQFLKTVEEPLVDRLFHQGLLRERANWQAYLWHLQCALLRCLAGKAPFCKIQIQFLRKQTEARRTWRFEDTTPW